MSQLLASGGLGACWKSGAWTTAHKLTASCTLLFALCISKIRQADDVLTLPFRIGIMMRCQPMSAYQGSQQVALQ